MKTALFKISWPNPWEFTWLNPWSFSNDHGTTHLTFQNIFHDLHKVLEKYRIKSALCKWTRLHQPNMHVVLALPFISTIVSLASTLPYWPLVAAYSNVQVIQMESRCLGSRAYITTCLPVAHEDDEGSLMIASAVFISELIIWGSPRDYASCKTILFHIPWIHDVVGCFAMNISFCYVYAISDPGNSRNT